MIDEKFKWVTGREWPWQVSGTVLAGARGGVSRVGTMAPEVEDLPADISCPAGFYVLSRQDTLSEF